LLSHIDELNTREALTVQDSLLAAYRAGEVESSVFLTGMEAFASHPEYDVAEQSGDLLGFMYRELPDARGDLGRLVQTLYAKRYAANVGKDNLEAKLLVPVMAGNLIERGADKTLQAEFAAKGASYLGLNGKIDKTKVAPNMIGLALRQAMKSSADAAYAPMLELAKSGSSLEKGAAAGALASTQDERVYKKILADVILAEESPLTGRQAGTVLNGLLRSEKFGDQTWDWFKANLATYVKKVPDVRKGGLPGAGGNFCSLDRRDEVKSFVQANAQLMPGYERSLLQTLESIELCAALKNAKGAELTAALKEQ